MTLISGLIGTLAGVAEFVFRVEFWRGYLSPGDTEKEKTISKQRARMDAFLGCFGF